MKREIFVLGIVLLGFFFGCNGLGGKKGSSASKVSGGPALQHDAKTTGVGIISSGMETGVGTTAIMNDRDDSEEIRMLRMELSNVKKELQLLQGDMKKVRQYQPRSVCQQARNPQSEVTLTQKST